MPLRPATRSALAALHLETPTPIQAAALPALLEGRDVIGQARTGSGKTLAFALPIVERLDARERSVQALVLVPTRELASQVAGVVREISAGQQLRTLLLVGGLSIGPQKSSLLAGVHVVVGTPGRVLDHIRQGNLKVGNLRILVLDEADEMLDRGFGPDVERIVSQTSRERQTALFSATQPEWLDQIAAKYMRSPLSVRVDPSSQPIEHVEHAVYDVPEGGKLTALRSLLDNRPEGVTLVFGRTKHGVKKLAKQLEVFGYPAAALQGNMSQNARDRVMADFRSGETPILLATNVAARGLDVENVAQVINYELPETAELLTHRVGRTGRMGRAGEAITLLTPEDELAWRKLLRELKRHPQRRPWKGRHESPHGVTAVVNPGAVRPAISRPAAEIALAQPAQPVARPATHQPALPVARPVSQRSSTHQRPAAAVRQGLQPRPLRPSAEPTRLPRRGDSAEAVRAAWGAPDTAPSRPPAAESPRSSKPPERLHRGAANGPLSGWREREFSASPASAADQAALAGLSGGSRGSAAVTGPRRRRHRSGQQGSAGSV